MYWADRSVLEAASWRLAGELMPRRPRALRLVRSLPGGGRSDSLRRLSASGDDGGGVRLDRNGTILDQDRFLGSLLVTMPEVVR